MSLFSRTIVTPELESLMLQVDLWLDSSLFRSIAPLFCYTPAPRSLCPMYRSSTTPLGVLHLVFSTILHVTLRDDTMDCYSTLALHTGGNPGSKVTRCP